jgi:hypothetical protein
VLVVVEVLGLLALGIMVQMTLLVQQPGVLGIMVLVELVEVTQVVLELQTKMVVVVVVGQLTMALVALVLLLVVLVVVEKMVLALVLVARFASLTRQSFISFSKSYEPKNVFPTRPEMA